MTPAKRRRVTLGALAVVLVVVIGAQLRSSKSATPAGSRARPSNQASGGRGAAAEAPVSDVNLELLKRDGAGYPEPERNPFKFQARPAPAPPQGRGVGPQPVAPPPVPPGPPPLPPIPWRYIGVFELPGGAGRVGIFGDGRGNTTQAKEGDIIDGRYRVLRVGPDSADVAYADGRGRQTLRLSGQ